MALSLYGGNGSGDGLAGGGNSDPPHPHPTLSEPGRSQGMTEAEKTKRDEMLRAAVDLGKPAAKGCPGGITEMAVNPDGSVSETNRPFTPGEVVQIAAQRAEKRTRAEEKMRRLALSAKGGKKGGPARAARLPDAKQKAAFDNLYLKLYSELGRLSFREFKQRVAALGGALTSKKGWVYFCPPGGGPEDEWEDSAENVRTRCYRLRQRQKREHE